jgi:hypothetical protein
MDSVGVLYRDAGCTGETVSHASDSALQPQAPDDVPGEGGDAGARTLLREVYQGVAEYRAEHGADPTELGQVLRHVHFTRASTENTLTVGRKAGGVCVSAVSSLGEPGRRDLSVDGEGRLYAGDACSGPMLEQFEAMADDPSAKPGTKPPS